MKGEIEVQQEQVAATVAAFQNIAAALLLQAHATNRQADAAEAMLKLNERSVAASEQLAASNALLEGVIYGATKQ